MAKPEDNAEVSLEVALKRCRALLRPHDQDAVIILTKPVVDEETGEESDVILCVPLGRISKGHAIFESAANNEAIWVKPTQLPKTAPRDDGEEQEEDAEAE